MTFENQPEINKFPHLASELQELVDADQDMRERSQTEDYWDENVDLKNTERMKQIIAKIGWPTISKVGVEGASNAWLLVQHADHDMVFQSECLRLMKEAPAGEVNVINVAYLEDRVRVNEGRGQLYGTQFTQEGGKHIPKTIEDVGDIDTRRAQVGMGPLLEQIQLMYNKYPLNEEK